MRAWLHAAVLAATVWRFWGCLWGDFLYDDDRIKHNDVVTGKAGWRDAFTTDFWGLPMSSRFSHKSYRPVAILSFRWHAAVVPMASDNTFSYHVVNVVLHLCVLYLLRRLSAMLAGDTRPLAVTATTLLFAVHPLLSETVRAWGFTVLRSPLA